MFSKFSDLCEKPGFLHLLILVIILVIIIIIIYLARVTYNQVQPLRINYLATEFLSKLELYD